MNIEKEMKFTLGNTHEVEGKVLSAGFVFEKEINQEDFYFSPAHKKFAGTKKYYLRLRKQSDDNCSFAYHEVIDDLQTKEIEVDIIGYTNFVEILSKLDFTLDCVVKKNRRVFKNNLFEITLDKVENLGSFIELEYVGGTDEETKSLFDKLIKNLGINKENIVAGLGYPDLLMDKLK